METWQLEELQAVEGQVRFLPSILLPWDESFKLDVLDLQLEVILPSLARYCESTPFSSGWVFRNKNDEAIEGIWGLELMPGPRLGVFFGGCRPLTTQCLMKNELHHLIEFFPK